MIVGKEDSPGIPFYKKPKDIQWHIITGKLTVIKTEVTANIEEEQSQQLPFGQSGKPGESGKSGKPGQAK